MAYSAGRNLPYERASKGGHLDLIRSAHIQKMIGKIQFQESPPRYEPPEPELEWKTLPDNTPLQTVVAIDGSHAVIHVDTVKGRRDLIFVKAAAVTMDLNRLKLLNPLAPHPLHISDILENCKEVYSTVLPMEYEQRVDALASLCSSLYESLRGENGELLDTLQWLLHKRWEHPCPSPSFACPYCGEERLSFPDGLDTMACPDCGRKLYLTDCLGLAPLAFKTDVAEKSGFAMAYHHDMLV